MLLFLLVYEIILVLIFFFFFFFFLNKTTSCKNKMSFPSEPDMMSKELQNSDLIYVNLMTDVFKIIVKYRWKIIAKYRHLSPSGNRALDRSACKLSKKGLCNKCFPVNFGNFSEHFFFTEHWFC